MSFKKLHREPEEIKICGFLHCIDKIVKYINQEIRIFKKVVSIFKLPLKISSIIEDKYRKIIEISKYFYSHESISP